MQRVLDNLYRIVGWPEALFDYFLFRWARMRSRSGRPKCTKQRVLLSRLDSVGDIVIFTACLKTYRELFNEAIIVLLVRDRTSELFQHCPFVDEVWEINTKKFRMSLAERFRWFRKLNAYGFDVAINAVYSMSWSHLDCLIGWTVASRRIAHECVGGNRKRLVPVPYFTELVPVAGEWKFEIDRNYDLLRYLGYRGQVSHTTEIYGLEKTSRERGESRYDDLPLPYAVLVPGGGDKIRRWRSDNFLQVIQEISTIRPFTWILCGNLGEGQLCARIAEFLGATGKPVLNFCGKTSLLEFALILKRASFVLSNETSAVHIAAAVRTPAICVLGGGHYGRFYPYPGDPLTVAVTHHLPCFGCEWKCILKEEECITRIRPEEVASAVLALLN